MGSTDQLKSWSDALGRYNINMFPFMAEVQGAKPETESYVSCPPALQVRDDEGGVWTLGFDYSYPEWLSGRYEYDVLRNGRKTGEFCRTIEYRGKRLRIFGAEGWRTWNGRVFV